jgi:type I restriction enzyme S subunit
MKTIVDHFAIGPQIVPIDTWNPQNADPDDEFDYIDIASVDRDSKAINGTTRIRMAEAPSRARQIVRAGDVIVSTVRPSLNAVALIPDHLSDAIASTGFCVLRCHPKKLNNRYLFHWVRTNQFVSAMVMQATGASYPAVSDRIIKDSKIPLPPLSEQKRIADILDKADAIRRKRRELRDSTPVLIDSIFAEMFGDVPSKRSPYPVTALREWLNVANGKSSRDIVTTEISGIPIYGGNGMNGWATQAMYQDPVIVIGRVGQQCGIMHMTTGPTWITDNAIAVQILDPSKLDRVYLAGALKRSTLGHDVRYIDLPYINQSMILDLPLPLPPLEKQREFARRTSAIGKFNERLGKAFEEVNGLFNALVQRAFRGEL